jgi:hypothetical protein
MSLICSTNGLAYCVAGELAPFAVITAPMGELPDDIPFNRI